MRSVDYRIYFARRSKEKQTVKSGDVYICNCGVSLGFARIVTFNGCKHDGWLAMENY